MSAKDLNRITLTARLTDDPELKSTPSGTSICELRVASNSRRKENDEWVDKPNFFNVLTVGKLAETVVAHLTKGRRIAIDGRLEHREWFKDDQRREAVRIYAEDINFLDPRPSDPADGQPVDNAELAGVAGSPDEADIPF